MASDPNKEHASSSSGSRGMQGKYGQGRTENHGARPSPGKKGQGRRSVEGDGAALGNAWWRRRDPPADGGGARPAGGLSAVPWKMAHEGQTVEDEFRGGGRLGRASGR